MADIPLFPRAHAPWFIGWPVIVLSRLLYKVRALNVDRIPAQGGALIVTNHLSYADVLVMQLACPRPIRFVGHEAFPRRSWLFRVIYKLTGTVPVSPANALETVRRVSKLLQAGELVLVFAEGGISRTGQLMKLQRGFEMMARKAGVPVVPAAHDGLWGSLFSFSDNKYLFKSPRLMRTAVCVAWGEPIPAAQADASTVRRALLDLGCEAFEERPQLKRHLGSEIVRRLGRHPGRLALVDRTASRRELKAAQLFAAAAALSRHIRKTVPESRVGIVLPPGAGASIVNLAVLCAGKVPVNFNFTAGRSAVESSLRMSGVKTIISADAMKSKAAGFPWPERTLDLTTTIKEIGGKRALFPWFLAAWILPNQLLPVLLGLPRKGDRAEAGLLFTSGSSGEPKGVPLTHRNILANCWQFSTLSIFPSSSVMLSCLPVFHSFGFTVNMWYPLLRPCRSVTVPSPLDTKKIIEAIREEKVTVMVGAPTFMRPILKKAEVADLTSLEVLVSGAEKMPMDLYESFLEKFKIEIMQGYGMTEASPATNVNQPDPAVPTQAAGHQDGKRLGSVGRMMAGMTARVLDPETRNELPAGETGIVAFRGANMFGGYLDDPKKTAEVFHDGWYITGDLGRFDEDGFLFIEGRLSRFSKIAGEMVPHGTVEQKLIEAFALDQSEGYALVVMGVPDPGKGEQLVLLSANDAITAESVKEKLTAAGVPNLWIPKTVERVEKIPVLGTGKLDLKSCKDLALKAAGVS
ncbi:AMP-binding protein [Rariglobus hedericola]|uniref:AMP-binding protein n=1 Tax=Rariglobus hedericola TaxID=2597822 RepID=A0A556QQ80_9BACT|nr:AMP-binding protein [Rariglobus hedericola]TSJ78779.1 AMP-binding protein [Rariglobus hedericola]